MNSLEVETIVSSIGFKLYSFVEKSSANNLDSANTVLGKSTAAAILN